MRRLIFAKINLALGLTIIAVVSVIAGSIVAYRSVGAFGLNVGGRITFVTECESGEALGLACPRCPFCSKLGPACAGYTEILYVPAGGALGEPAICVPKAYPYRGGGGYPRIGGMLKAKMLTPFIPIQVGVGR